jgi:2-dehydropantoate 2-reductase
MNICVYGAGALGGNVAARLSASGRHDISVVARGATLAAIRERGLTLHTGGGEITGRPRIATDDPAVLPPQDLVVVALKAPVLPPLAASIARLIAPGGCALFLLNGIPWWWRYKLPGTPGPLQLLDPDGALWEEVRPERALHCVVYSANEVLAPGVVEHSGNNRWVIGEPDGTASSRATAAVEAFCAAGLGGERSADIRRDIWRKLAVNASGNPLSALTQQGFREMGADEGLRSVMAGLARETLAVAAALGCDLRQEIDVEKLARRETVKHGLKTSILQDVLSRRPLEVEALLGQTQLFARESGIPVPTMDVIVPLLRGLDRALRAAARESAAAVSAGNV